MNVIWVQAGQNELGQEVTSNYQASFEDIHAHFEGREDIAPEILIHGTDQQIVAACAEYFDQSADDQKTVHRSENTGDIIISREYKFGRCRQES
jgi:hypothetical protein